jgi:hypothetical protein
MGNDNMSPLELVSQDVNMDDSYLTMHVSTPEGGPAHLPKNLDMARDELEKSGEFTQPRIGKIMAGLPESPSPNDWTISHEVGVTFNQLYPTGMYAFSSPPSAPKKPSVQRHSTRRNTRSQSPSHRYPTHPSHRHLRRNAIIPPLSPEHQRPSKRTALSKLPATTTTTTRPSTPSTGSPFMDLPGELKNRIYFYALVRKDNVEISAANWDTHQPALLKTCKQIRREALSIFYNENRVSANIEDWNPEVKNACHDLWAHHKLKWSAQFSHYFTGKPHWQNLIAWLEAFFLEDMKGISDVVSKTRTLERKTVGVMFLMATTARENQMPWKALKVMLDAQRGLLSMKDGRWELEN